MRYFAKYSGEKLVAVGIGLGGEEITEEQYNAMREETHEKCRYVDLLCRDEITMEEVPERWRAEIERRFAESYEAELSAEEVLMELLDELRL